VRELKKLRLFLNPKKIRFHLLASKKITISDLMTLKEIIGLI